jgi:gluconolactonase
LQRNNLSIIIAKTHQKMNTKTLTLIFALLAIESFAQNTYPVIGSINRIDAGLDALLAKDAKIEVLATGFDWSEGPAWVKNGQYLVFSDVPQNTIYRWNAKDGVSVFLKPSGYTGRGYYSKEPGSNGLIINKKNQLVACEHGDRRISVMPLEGGGKRTLSDHCEGKRFNSPNDLVEHSSGAYFFTDPPYGLPQYDTDPSRETSVFGVYKITPDGKTTLIIKDLTRPNGVTLSPDESILYVAQSDPDRAFIMAYPLSKEGTIGQGSIFFDTTPMVKKGLVGLPDGLKTDLKGNVWTTGSGGVLVITPQGKHLGTISTGEATANCAWGDDGSTLYITADMYLCRIKTLTKGF